MSKIPDLIKRTFQAVLQTVNAALFVVITVIIVMTIMQSVIPATMALPLMGKSVDFTEPIEMLISSWLIPALFAVGLLFYATLLVLRGVWRLQKLLHNTIPALLSPKRSQDSWRSV